MPMLVTRVTDVLPPAFPSLRQEARAEGFNHLERLAAGWAAGAMRFDQKGEALFVAQMDGTLAGIGGITVEPTIGDTALRMRRFYIRPSVRRQGVGQRLAQALIDHGRHYTQLITVNAAVNSVAFWEALGFVATHRDGYSHVLRLPQSERR